MKCPHCGYVSFTETEKCKKCGMLIPRETAEKVSPPTAASVELRKAMPTPEAAGELPLNPSPEAPPAEQPAQPTAAAVQSESALPSPPAPGSTEWKNEIRKRVQERREKATPEGTAAAPRQEPHVEEASHSADVRPPAGHRVREMRQVAQTASPYDTTVEMGPPPKAAAPEALPLQKSDQIPLFPEQVAPARVPIKRKPGPLADHPIHSGGGGAPGDELAVSEEPAAGRKAAACAFDAALVAIPWLVSLFSVDKMLGTGPWSLLRDSWIPFLLLFLVLHTLYGIFFLPALGETPGLAILGLRLTSNGRPGSFRAIVFSAVSLLSLAALGVGFFWALFDPDQRCWPELSVGGRLVRR